MLSPKVHFGSKKTLNHGETKTEGLTGPEYC